MKWMRLGTRTEVDLVQYIKQYLKEKPETKIYIGTDSQVHSGRTDFGVVVVLHYKNNGGQTIYYKQSMKNFYSGEERLLHEVSLTIDAANILREAGIDRPLRLHLDLNPDELYKSNKVLTQAMGWVRGMGYECDVKPNAFAASYVADKICKG